MDLAGGASLSGTGNDGERLSFPNETRSVSLARHAVQDKLAALGLEDLTGADLVATELVGNAVLHTDGPVQLEVTSVAGGVRISVFDSSPVLPVVPTQSTSSMTGRGLLLVRSMAARFGFGPTAGGKVVWAELRREQVPDDAAVDSLIEAWADDWDTGRADPSRHQVELGEVPTDLLLEAKSHVDNLVREFLLAASGARSGITSPIPPHLAELIETVVGRFAEARLSIKRQALEASRLGKPRTSLRLQLTAQAADAGVDYLRALDEADAYCRAARLLTLETPPKHRVFRQWYVGELVTQLRRAEAGLPVGATQAFELRLLDEIDTVAHAWAVAERAARLSTVASALSGALTPEAVAQAVLEEGVIALGASGGGLILPAGGDRLSVPGTVGYDDAVVESLRAESAAAELPAAVCLRTGQPVWLESREERDARFPELVDMEQSTVSMCAVPLQAAGRSLGALRFSFSESRLFDDDERQFVLALAAQAAQALDRAQLYRERSELSRRLQVSLLPPGLPCIPGVGLAAVYHPLGAGAEIGGDFYDVWDDSPGRWFFAIGDVCGTGPEAAGLTALVRHSLRAITRLEPDCAQALRHLNDLLLDADHDHDERFCTVILGAIIAGADGIVVRLATGGHPGPVLRPATGDPWVITTGGSLLGVLAAVEIVSAVIELGAGDSLIFYTDGVTEARGATGMFGTDRLLASAAASSADASQVASVLVDDILAHTDGVLRDDVAILVIRPHSD